MFSIHADEIIRSKRRTFSLEVTHDARLIVRVPQRATSKMIEDVVFRKRSWILEKQDFARKTFQTIAPKKFTDGEKFLYLGETYPLHFSDHLTPPLIFERSFLLSVDFAGQAERILIEWYQLEAWRVISERVRLYAAKAGFHYGKLKLSNARKRWGSCSPNGNLRFSWRLVMAPLAVIDYVVVHELAHLLENNHSKHFWNRVKLLLPDYKHQERWLKENYHLFNI